MKQGKSQAQDRIADIVSEAYPGMVVRQEVPIGDVIVASGYEPSELEPELRHRIHRMSIDVYATDYSTSFAIEYQGEQHYESVGRMNETGNAVRWDQELDEEKMWVLQRVGVPIVQIAYDEPVSPAIIRHLVDRASEAMRGVQNALYVCNGCGRRFPRERLSNGLCVRCRGISDDDGEDDKYETDRASDNHARDEKEAARQERRRRWQEYKASDEYAERKRQSKEARKRAMEEYRQSDLYKQRKEEEKAWRKARREEEKERRRTR